MDKVMELLGKIVQALLSSKTIWLIVVAAAIFTLALLLIIASFPDVSRFLGITDTFKENWQEPIGLAALASMALILAKTAIWVVGLLRDQFLP